MHTALIRYRSEPTDRNFKTLYDASRGWIRGAAVSTVRQYHGLTSADVDDVANEGLLSLANAARRFVYFCPRCGDAFVYRSSLEAHAREEHRVRGPAALVSLEKFAQVNSRLGMKRTARRLLRPGEVLDDDPASDLVVAPSILTEILVRDAARRLSGEAEKLLLELVFGADELVIDEEEESILRYIRLRAAAGFSAPASGSSGFISSQVRAFRRPRMTTPELNEVEWKKLKLKTLVDSTSDVFEFKPRAKTIKEAFAEVVAELAARGVETPFVCGNCNAPIDEDSPKCWACGASLSDEQEEEEPEISPDELVARATKLKIDVDGKTPEEIAGLIEAVERRKRESKRADMTGMEAKALNEKATELMGDGWRKKETGQYTGYWDPSGACRFCVFKRGLVVHFRVADGDLEGFKGVEFYDKEERRRRHYGRTNYAYVGDITKEAIAAIASVVEKYGS